MTPLIVLVSHRGSFITSFDAPPMPPHYGEAPFVGWDGRLFSRPPLPPRDTVVYREVAVTTRCLYLDHWRGSRPT